MPCMLNDLKKKNRTLMFKVLKSILILNKHRLTIYTYRVIFSLVIVSLNVSIFALQCR